MTALRASLVASALVALTACASDASPEGETGSTFLAFASSFTGYHTWRASHFSSAAPQATPDGAVVHGAGTRTVYLNKTPPPGSTAFPVGTIIVKEIDGSDTNTHRVFAMVKRGASYNEQGAAGWEWFELENSATDTVKLVWRGIGPASGDPYSTTTDGIQVCNRCHGAAKANDFVLSSALLLTGFLGRKMRFLWLPALASSCLLAAASTAHANPRPFPFTYIYETLPEGEVEIEQYADYVPVRAFSVSTSAPAWVGATQLQTEFEYGLSERLELGLYVTFAPPVGEAFASSPRLPGGNGIKQRLRYRVADEGDLPVDIGLYGELVELQNELEIEARVILQKRFGLLRATANLWGEREFYYDGHNDWVVNPSAGLSYQVTPTFQPGIEAWVRSEYPSPTPRVRDFSLGPHAYVGPAALLSFGKLWVSTGAYVRATKASHTLQPGEPFGNVWFRSVVGVDL